SPLSCRRPPPAPLYTLSLHDALPILMTPAARRFITPLTLATLSGNPVLDDLWAPPSVDLDLGARPEDRKSAIEHIEIADAADLRSEEHTSELQSLAYLVCRLLLEKKK